MRRSAVSAAAQDAGAEMRAMAGHLAPWAFGDYVAEYSAALDGAAVLDLSCREFVSVTGSDAESFLQGMVTQDVAAIRPGGGALSLLLTPQGKVDSFFRALRLEEGFLLDTDPGFGCSLVASLERFKIRVDVSIEPHNELVAVGLRGPISWDALTAVAGAAIAQPGEAEYAHLRLRLPLGGEVRVVRTRLGRVRGFDVIAEEPVAARLWRDLCAEGLTRVGMAAVEAFRVEAGVPAMGSELDGQTMTQEAGLEQTAVSFTKGCYVGQELVARIDSRGNVNRLLRGLFVAGGEIPPRGSAVAVDGRQVGTVTSVADSVELGGTVALAYVRREVDPAASAVVSWECGSEQCEIRALPLVPA